MHIVSLDHQDKALSWARLDKDNHFWPDAIAASVLHTKVVDGKATGRMDAVAVFQNIGNFQCEVHFKARAGSGWASRPVLTALFDIPFNQLRLTRLYATTDLNNVKSMTLLTKLGFLPEGQMRDGHGPGRDATLWAILRKECRWL